MKYYRVKEYKNILRTIKRRKSNWIGHILHSASLIKRVIVGKIEERLEVTRRRGRRRKQITDKLKETTEYWKLKKEALDRPMCRTRCGRVYGPVVRQTTE
jgi:hypothetical protein